MITTFTNRTGTDACPSVPTTKLLAHRVPRAVPDEYTVVPDPQTARRYPHHPAVTSWSARQLIGHSVLYLGTRLSTTVASRITTVWRLETRPETRSLVFRALPSPHHHRRRRPRYHLRRHLTYSTRNLLTNSGGR